METDSGAQSSQFEPGEKRRVTRLGAFLRRTKLDEVPELFNIFFGDMSLVGPRPEVEKYTQFYPDDFKEILKVRPGLSDFASVKYRNEEEILAKQDDPEEYYINEILPDKLKLARKYLEEISFKADLKIIGSTLKSLLFSRKQRQ
jgi:lipopolysaccharide/colanic/teichoic acid biosynthesis glycosyltransferase